MFNQLQITSLLVRNIQAKETTIEPYIIHFSLNQVTEKQKYFILYYLDFKMRRGDFTVPQTTKQCQCGQNISWLVPAPNFISKRLLQSAGKKN